MPKHVYDFAHGKGRIEIHAAKKAADKTVVEIVVYGYIGESYWEDSVSGKSVVAALKDLEADEILVRINSMGGSVYDGIAIYNALRDHDARVVTRVEGQAASIASLILMAGDEAQAFENATVMVHAPWAYAGGNAVQMREYADQLDKIAGSMAASYARKTGKGKPHALALLTDGKDHLYTAEEALSEGFLDKVITEGADDSAGETADTVEASAMSELFHDLAQPTPSGLQHLAIFAAARGNTTEQKMPDPIKPAAQSSATETEIQAAQKQGGIEAIAAEKARKEEVSGMFALIPEAQMTAAMSKLQVECLKDENITAAEAGKKILALQNKALKPSATGGQGQAEDDPTLPRVQAGETAKEKRVKGMETAILAKAQLGKDDRENEFRSYTLLEMARICASEAGVAQKGFNKLEVVGAAFTHSTSDFTNVLANIAHKSMLKGYDEAQESFPQFTSEGSLSDYKLTKRVDLNSFASLPKVEEGGEYAYASVGDHGENVLLGKYGRLFSITREAIINDDLSVFTKVPRKMGRAAIRTIGDLVFAILTGNPAMTEDGVALFNAAHGNLVAAGTPITSTSVDQLRQLMVLQKDRTSTTTALGIRLAKLVVPVALGAVARQVRDSQFQVDVATAAKGSQNTIPNPVKGIFDVVEDYRLDAASSISWYGAADPAINDTIEVSYLDGNKQPWLENRMGWSVDGAEFKVRIEAVAKALDYKGLAKNPGA